jgi:Fe2+ or Zn2+ uptake regulation protein
MAVTTFHQNFSHLFCRMWGKKTDIKWELLKTLCEKKLLKFRVKERMACFTSIYLARQHFSILKILQWFQTRNFTHIFLCIIYVMMTQLDDRKIIKRMNRPGSPVGKYTKNIQKLYTFFNAPFSRMHQSRWIFFTYSFEYLKFILKNMWKKNPDWCILRERSIEKCVCSTLSARYCICKSTIFYMPGVNT